MKKLLWIKQKPFSKQPSTGYNMIMTTPIKILLPSRGTKVLSYAETLFNSESESMELINQQKLSIALPKPRSPLPKLLITVGGSIVKSISLELTKPVGCVEPIWHVLKWIRELPS